MTMQLTAADKATLYRELAKLIGADFHVDRAVDLLAGQNPPQPRKAFLEGLQRGLARGDGIAKALEQENRALVTGMEIALVSAGETSGRLAQPFEHLARYFAAVDDGVRQARSAMIYPLILVHLAIVLPELPALFVDTGKGNPVVPIVTKLAIFWLLALVVWQIWKALSTAAVKSAAVDRFLNRLPLIGKARQHWALARFTQVFHAGLLAAMRMAHVTRISGEASQSGVMLHGAESAATRIDDGAQLAPSLRQANAFPRMFVDSVATAEEVGSLDKEMQRWATAETDLAGEAMQRMAIWLPKAGYAIIVLYVAWRIVSMFMGIYEPIFRMSKEL